MENETIKKMNKLESKIAKISQMERKLCYPDHLKNIELES